MIKVTTFVRVLYFGNHVVLEIVALVFVEVEIVMIDAKG
jgi:hypothetical protein